jgi:hypothetical protein
MDESTAATFTRRGTDPQFMSRSDEAASTSLEKLQRFLMVDPPGMPHESPPVFSFKRKREVRLPWRDIVGPGQEQRPASITAMRDYFQLSWGLDPDGTITQPFLSSIIAKDDAHKHEQMIGDLDAEQPEPSYRATPSPAYRTRFIGDLKNPVDATELSTGIVFRHGLSRRRYWVRPRQGETLTIQDFTEPARYEASWEKIDGFDLVFDSPDDAKRYYTNFEELDLRPVYIERRFKELDLMLGLARTVDEQVPALSTDTLKQLLEAGADLAEVDAVYQRFLRLRMTRYDVERAIDRLVTFAADLGFVLSLETKDIMNSDGTQKVGHVDRGRIYRLTKRRISWTTTERRPVVEVSWWLIIPVVQVRTEAYLQDHTEILPVPELVDTSSDRLRKWQEAYLRDHPGAQLFLFDQTTSGYVTATGLSLRDVMERCGMDEEFRRRCVVVLPIYEQSLTGARALIKYHAFERPLPGILPTSMPRLSVEESLSYRMAWRGIELGELMSSVNLAPGERRTVHVTKQFEQETEVAKTTTSVFELEETTSTDLTQEMEREFGEEQQHSTSAQLSTSISASYLGVTAQASASYGVDNSLSEFAKTTSKVAKKASQSVSRRNRQEVTTSTTARTTVTTTDDMVAEVENINEGRTLNLMFYRLYNRYHGGLYLEDLQFDVVPSVELIAGSGIYASYKFGLGDLRRLINALSTTPLPFDLGDEGQAKLADVVLGSVETLFMDEYGDRPDKLGDDQWSLSVGLLTLPPLRAVAADRQGRGIDALDAAIDDLSGRLRVAHKNLRTNVEIEPPIDLVVASRGLYLDALVGNQPSTEPYSETMRAKEIAMRAAEVFAKESEGILSRAQASRITRLTGGDSGLVLTDLHYDRRELKSLTLGLNGLLPGGEWQLLVDHEKKDGNWLFMDDREVTIRFEQPQEWLKSIDLIWKIALYNPITGVSIAFAMPRRAADATTP